MRFYLRFGEGGLNFVDSDLSESEFKEQIRAGNNIHPLYDAKGKRKYNYPAGLSNTADIFPQYPFIPFNGRGTKYKNEKRGFIAVPMRYKAEILLSTLKEMGVDFEPDNILNIQDFLTYNGLAFLQKINCSVFNVEMYSQCMINVAENLIIFLSTYCWFLQGDSILVIVGQGVYKLKDDSPYKLFYIPCELDDLIYAKFNKA